MRFSEWRQKLEEQNSRLAKMGMPATETVILDGKVIIVTLSGSEIQLDIDGYATSQIRNLSPIYTKHKQEMDDLLDSLTDQVECILSNGGAILDGITADKVPEIVLKRMMGEQVSADPHEMIKAKCEKLLNDLDKNVIGSRLNFIQDIRISLRVNNADLFLSFGPHRQIIWKNTSILRGIVTTGSTGDCLKFMQFYPEIKAKIKEFLTAMEPIRRLTE